jgi:hypothetical protein
VGTVAGRSSSTTPSHSLLLLDKRDKTAVWGGRQDPHEAAILRRDQEAAAIRREQEVAALRRDHETAAIIRRDQEAYIRRDQEAAAAIRREQEVNLRREQEVNLRREQEVNLRREQEVNLRREQEVNLRREQEVNLRREQEVNLRREQEVNLRREQEASLARHFQSQRTGMADPRNPLGLPPGIPLLAAGLTAAQLPAASVRYWRAIYQLCIHYFSGCSVNVHHPPGLKDCVTTLTRENLLF